jgi:hypothetical protein
MNKRNIAKRNARGFERWLDDAGRSWPGWLYQLALDCMHALNMVPGQERHLKNKAFASCVERPVVSFHEAYAEYLRDGR